VGHPLASLGYATANGVYLSAGRIDALLVCAGQVLRTADPLRTRFGLAQVRRELALGALRALHLIFAPDASRPLLLGIAQLRNAGDSPLVLAYTETWEVEGGDYRAAEGACERLTPDGALALAEVSLAVRARAPEPPPRTGLALQLKLLLPPRSRRELHFAYAAPGLGDSPANLVRAWRGRVAEELARSVRLWQQRIGDAPSPIEAYRARATASA
jgi:hypothetical protein